MREETAGLSSRSVPAFIGRVISLSLGFPISIIVSTRNLLVSVSLTKSVQQNWSVLQNW